MIKFLSSCMFSCPQNTISNKPAQNLLLVKQSRDIRKANKQNSEEKKKSVKEYIGIRPGQQKNVLLQTEKGGQQRSILKGCEMNDKNLQVNQECE